MFTKNNNIKLNREIYGKINFYSCNIEGGFKMFVTFDEENISDSLRKF